MCRGLLDTSLETVQVSVLSPPTPVHSSLASSPAPKPPMAPRTSFCAHPGASPPASIQTGPRNAQIPHQSSDCGCAACPVLGIQAPPPPGRTQPQQPGKGTRWGQEPLPRQSTPLATPAQLQALNFRLLCHLAVIYSSPGASGL